MADHEAKTPLLSGGTYDVLKQAAQIWLPAAGTLYFTLAQIWGLPAAEEVVGTIVAVDLFLGTVIGISKISYNKSEARFDGQLEIAQTDQGLAVLANTGDLTKRELLKKDEITLRVKEVQFPDEGPLAGADSQ